MIVTISSALLFGVIAIVLIRLERVTTGNAVLVWLSGFTVAGTGLAAPVNHLLTALFTAIAHIH